MFMQNTWEQARDDGRMEEAARSVLTALRVRGIEVPDAARKRILAEKDRERLERWLERAILASSIVDVLDDVGPALAGKIVVDATNPLKPDYSGLATEGTSGAEEIQARIPTARVVKAFNTAFAARQTDPRIAGMQVDGYVAADDEEAKAIVLELVKGMGFHPIDAGDLAMARALEALAWLNISLQMRHGWSWQSGWKLVGPEGDAT